MSEKYNMNFLKKLYNNWCKIDDKIRFLFIGGVNTAFSYILFIIFIFLLGEEKYQLAVILQWVVSSIFSFCNQKFFVFCTKGHFFKEYLKCCSTWLVGCYLNEVILKILLTHFKNVYLMQFISIGLVSVFTYVIFKYFAFKRQS